MNKQDTEEGAQQTPEYTLWSKFSKSLNVLLTLTQLNWSADFYLIDPLVASFVILVAFVASRWSY